MQIIAAIVSRYDFPLMSATPYSVTMTSRSARGSVAFAYVQTMLDWSPCRRWRLLRTAMIARASSSWCAMATSVLASDAAHDAPIFQSVRRDGAQERRRHRRVDKSRMPTVGALTCGFSVERIGERDRRHADLGQLLLGHCPEVIVEALVADEESCVQ